MEARGFPYAVILIGIILIGVSLALFFRDTWNRLMSEEPMTRQHQFTMIGLPVEYSRRQNPLHLTTSVIKDGERLYQVYCAACHGERGYGDGPNARELKTPPANLFRTMRIPMSRDDYLFWTIGESGKAFNSAMPAFNESLSEEERWKAIHYLRQL